MTVFGTFFIFVSKVNIQMFFLRDSISIITITRMLACYPRQQATHTTHVSTPPTQPTLHTRMQPKLERQPRQHATHESMPPTVARQHAIHASMLLTPPMSPTPPTLAYHPVQHATHTTYANTNSTPFNKLIHLMNLLLNVQFYELFFLSGQWNIHSCRHGKFTKDAN